MQHARSQTHVHGLRGQAGRQVCTCRTCKLVTAELERQLLLSEDTSLRQHDQLPCAALTRSAHAPPPGLSSTTQHPNSPYRPRPCRFVGAAQAQGTLALQGLVLSAQGMLCTLGTHAVLFCGRWPHRRRSAGESLPLPFAPRLSRWRKRSSISETMPRSITACAAISGIFICGAATHDWKRARVCAARDSAAGRHAGTQAGSQAGRPGRSEASLR